MFRWFRKKAGAAPAAQAPASAPTPSGRAVADFSRITSRALAEAACRDGSLRPVLLMPAALGGEDAAVNVTFLPAVAADAKHAIDLLQVLPLAQQGRITRYDARPHYQGESFVPARLTIEATGPGRFHAEVRVWGDGTEPGASAATPGTPEGVVQAFVQDYFAWNEEAASTIDAPHDEARDAAIEAAYDALVARHAAPGVKRQPISYGTDASHDPGRTRVVSVAVAEDHAVVRTCIPMGSYTTSVHVHEFELVLHEGRWRLTGVCLVDEGGRWPGL